MGTTVGLSLSLTVTKMAPAVGSELSAAICAFANALPKESAMPMTSPVDRILGPQHGVEFPKLVEREDGLLDRHIRRRDFAGEPDLGQRVADHDARRDGGERYADRLRDEGHRPAGARIHFQDVDDSILDRELDVDQADHAQRFGERDRLLAHERHVPFADQVGWEYARRVTGADPRILDVLHHAADHHVVRICHRVDVGLECVLQKSVDQDRPLLRAGVARRKYSWRDASL